MKLAIKLAIGGALAFASLAASATDMPLSQAATWTATGGAALGTTGSDVLFSIYSIDPDANKYTAVFDLGVTYQSLVATGLNTAGTEQVWNLGSFAPTGNTSALNWSIAGTWQAASGSSGRNNDFYNVLTTAVAGTTVSAGTTALANLVGNLN